MSPPHALILGHSFIRHLSSFLSHSNIYSHNLGLQDVAEIALFGVGGRMITKVEKFNLGFVPGNLTSKLSSWAPKTSPNSLQNLLVLPLRS